MTVKELREEAKRLGLTGYSRMNKAQLEEAVNNAQHQAQEQAQDEAAQAIINSNPEDWSITAIVQDEQASELNAT